MKATTRTSDEQYGPALAKARRDLAGIEPVSAATRAGVSYAASATAGGWFSVRFLGDLYWIGWPDGEVARASGAAKVDVASRILVLHYILAADGTAMADRWIAFRNLPGGLGYDGAFQGRAGQRLAREFGSDKAAFEAASRALGGEALAFGDASFAFRALPRVWLAVVLSLADDEFSANASVLFDAAASHYLPTEDLAVLGGLLAGRLIKQANPR